MEQRGAMPLEVRLGPAHASGAAPGQHDTGHLTHVSECTYLSERAFGRGDLSERVAERVVLVRVVEAGRLRRGGLTSSDAPIAPPRSPSAATCTAGEIGRASCRERV